MLDEWRFVLDDSFDLEEALAGPDRERALRALADMIRAEAHLLRQHADRGLTPEAYKRLHRVVEGMHAAGRIVEKLRLLALHGA